MARTLSDGLIIAMIEATTRLVSARGGPGPKAGTAEPAPADDTARDDTARDDTAKDDTAKDGAAKDEAVKEARTAANVSDDFATIYARIEELVRVSAEQETKAVGFTVR